MTDVRHHLPGGRETGGGIGRLVGYIVDAAPAASSHRVTDTRGSRWSLPGSLLRLSFAAVALVQDRIVAPDRLQHIHVAGRGSTARKLLLTAVARLLRQPHLLHLHDYDYAADFARRPPWQQALVRRMFRGAHRVVVLGRRDRDVVTGRIGVPADRVVVLGNCVPDPGERPAGSNREAPRILFLGTLGERKGVPELLAALGGPMLADLPWTAVLAGDGPVEAYRQQVVRLGLAERVNLPGWVGEAEVRALLRDADILVLPSRGEGLAMAVLEGLAHGLAVVTTRVGAHDEVIEEGANGIFVPVGDVAALETALGWLLREPETRARLGAAARRRYRAELGMEAYMQRLGEVYRSLARPEPQPVARRGAA